MGHGLIKQRIELLPLLIILIMPGFGCKKFIEVDAPITNTNSDVVFKSDGTAIAAVNSMYVSFSQDGISSGLTSLSLYAGFSSDELDVLNRNFNEVALAYKDNQLSPTKAGGEIWTSVYSKSIFNANAAINGLRSSTSLTPSIKNQLLGEALVIRAFCYFYLVNLYGDVPLVLSTDYRINSSIGRTSAANVYGQLINDLKEAELLLSTDYLDGTILKSTVERTTINRYVATSLLARVYLFIQDWSNAVLMASAVIDNKAMYDTVSLDQVFLVNSKECLWQIQSVNGFVTNTTDAFEFLSAKSFFPGARSCLNNDLVQSFSPFDNRRRNWIDSVESDNRTYYLPNKYKITSYAAPVTERTVVMRLAEQYLIRAEARAKTDDLPGAESDLNVIRLRAGLAPVAGASKQQLLTQIEDERRKEFFAEWGHRWFDLKRTERAVEVLAPKKGVTFRETDLLYPIPQTEILQNPALEGHQNPGY